MRIRVLAGAVGGLVLVAGSAVAQLPNGVAAGDTTESSTVLWARSLATGNVTFQVSTDAAFGAGSIVGTFNSSVTDVNLPVKASVGGLSGGTRYYYRATDASGAVDSGTFKTATPAGTRAGLRLGVSGDYRGDVAPFAFGRNIASRNLDLYVSLGDTIYGDVASPALPGVGQAQTVDQFRLKHAENLTARGGINTLADIRRSTSTLATIDDHEVTNDFAGYATVSTDARFTFGGAQPTDRLNQTPLYNNGLRAFHDYHPIQPQSYSTAGDARTDGRPELYRSRRYGNDAQVFVTDARSFRDTALPGVANPLDGGQVAGFIGASWNPARTMLGSRQLGQLKSDLLAAQSNGVTWKFVNLPEPTQNLGILGASDRYEGYAYERNDLLRFIKTNNIQNVVFITADIHGTLVNNLTYQNSPGGPQNASGAWEISTGSGGYDAPFGPTVFGLAAQLGLTGTLTLQQYLALPAAQQEVIVEGLVNAQLGQFGYDPLGLQGSDIPATLLQGGYTATNSYGWTEFEIDAVTQALTVTTYGVPWYPAGTDPAIVAGLQPTILSQFVVQAVPTPGAAGLLGFGLVVAARRRRR